MLKPRAIPTRDVPFFLQAAEHAKLSDLMALGGFILDTNDFRARILSDLVPKGLVENFFYCNATYWLFIPKRFLTYSYIFQSDRSIQLLLFVKNV